MTDDEIRHSARRWACWSFVLVLPVSAFVAYAISAERAWEHYVLGTLLMDICFCVALGCVSLVTGMVAGLIFRESDQCKWLIVYGACVTMAICLIAMAAGGVFGSKNGSDDSA